MHFLIFLLLFSELCYWYNPETKHCARASCVSFVGQALVIITLLLTTLLLAAYCELHLFRSLQAVHLRGQALSDYLLFCRTALSDPELAPPGLDAVQALLEQVGNVSGLCY